MEDNSDEHDAGDVSDVDDKDVVGESKSFLTGSCLTYCVLPSP
jgi:hypothetical protein